MPAYQKPPVISYGAMMPRRPTALTERLGVDAASTAFHGMGWYFREQAVSDFGIDAEVEIAGEDQRPTGQLLALQIKSGASYFRRVGDDYVYRGSHEHLEYWLRHCLPVFIILHNPDTGLTLWQRIEQHLVTVTDTGWSIRIPAANVLDNRSKRFLEAGISSDDASYKRYRFAADKADMGRYKDKDVFFTFDVWVNKSLSIRGMEVRFDDPEKNEADEVVDVWVAYYTVHDMMARYYPWLDYSYHDFIHADEGCGEIETHIFEVRLNEAAKAFLFLEAFYDEPIEPKDPPLPGQEEAEEFERMEAEGRRQDWLDDEDGQR